MNLTELKLENYKSAGVEEADLKVLEGMLLKGEYEEIKKKVPKSTKPNKVNSWVEENMGSAKYKKYIEAIKKHSYLVRRAEEQEGLAEFKNGIFKNYRAYAYPVNNKIVKTGKNAQGADIYNIRAVTEYKSKDSIFLTHQEGYITPKHAFQNELIEQLKSDINEGFIGDTIELSDGELKIYFRLTIELSK